MSQTGIVTLFGGCSMNLLIRTRSGSSSMSGQVEAFYGSSGKWGGAASQRQAMETAALCKPWKNK